MPDAGDHPAAAAGEPDGTLEDVTVVPRSRLETPGVIRSPLLPFDVEVLKYFPNSKLREVRAGDDNLATAGAGKRLFPRRCQPGSGTDIGSKSRPRHRLCEAVGQGERCTDRDLSGRRESAPAAGRGRWQALLDRPAFQARLQALHGPN